MRSFCVPAFLLLLLSAQGHAEDAVKARMTWITDFRHVKAEKPKTPKEGELDFSLESTPSLSIGLELEGDVLTGANARSELTYKVTDDKGKALDSFKDVLREPGAYLPLRRDMDFKTRVVLRRNRINLQINAASPARIATKVSVEGKVTLLVGKLTDVVVPGVTKLVGKTIDHKDLKSAGLEIKVKSVNAMPDIEGTQVFFQIAGKFRHLVEFQLLDEKDNLIGSGGDEFHEIGFPPEEGAYPALIFAKGKLDPATFKLRVHVLLDAKDTVVPFTLKDIALP